MDLANLIEADIRDVRREFREALRDGAYDRAVRIYEANPDVFGINRDVPAYPIGGETCAVNVTKAT